MAGPSRSRRRAGRRCPLPTPARPNRAPAAAELCWASRPAQVLTTTSRPSSPQGQRAGCGRRRGRQQRCRHAIGRAARPRRPRAGWFLPAVGPARAAKSPQIDAAVPPGRGGRAGDRGSDRPGRGHHGRVRGNGFGVTWGLPVHGVADRLIHRLNERARVLPPVNRLGDDAGQRLQQILEPRPVAGMPSRVQPGRPHRRVKLVRHRHAQHSTPRPGQQIRVSQPGHRPTLRHASTATPAYSTGGGLMLRTLRTLALVPRCAVIGALCAGLAGGAVGFILGLLAHAPTAWFAIFELGIPATVAGGAVGAVTGLVGLGVRRLSTR